MDSVPMPRDLSEEAVARWMHGENHAYIRDTLGECGRTWDATEPDERTGEEVRKVYRNLARAVLALVRDKVRECIAVTESRYSMPRFAPKDKAYGSIHPGATDDEIIARVMGEEAPRA